MTDPGEVTGTAPRSYCVSRLLCINLLPKPRSAPTITMHFTLPVTTSLQRQAMKESEATSGRCLPDFYTSIHFLKTTAGLGQRWGTSTCPCPLIIYPYSVPSSDREHSGCRYSLDYFQKVKNLFVHSTLKDKISSNCCTTFQEELRYKNWLSHTEVLRDNSSYPNSVLGQGEGSFGVLTGYSDHHRQPPRLLHHLQSYLLSKW